ncbi:hypothetical protein LXA43DRAFT_893242 [Ganoderma leucocontextum]|nr:hypothetical protein LXA43DRAFT_893242 [Ganoderma leucocontextum]
MATVFRTVTTFSTKVTALNDTTTELRRPLFDNQSRIRRIDAVARTSFLEQWEGYRADFQRLLEMSEAAAIKFSATIDYYLSLQEETNDPAEVDETIQELSAFHKVRTHRERQKLSQLSLNQTAEFGYLDGCLDTLEKGIVAAVVTQRNLVCQELENTKSRIPSLEEELEQCRRREQYEAALATAQHLWTTHGCHMFNAESTLQYTAQLTHTGATPQMWTRTERQRQLIGGWDFQEESHIERIEGELKDMRASLARAESAFQEYESLNVDEVRDAIQDIRQNLATQSALQDDIFSDVTTKLTKESESYLDALQKARVDSSPAGQLAYRNKKQRILSSSVGWGRRARVLVDEYAKKMK